jgi:two-component system sensor histidine kinase EvgS
LPPAFHAPLGLLASLCALPHRLIFASWRQALRRRRVAESELRERVLFKRAMLEGVPYAICVRDAQARLVFCNAAYEKLFARKREDIEGKTLLESKSDFLDKEGMRRLHQRYLDLMADNGKIAEDVEVWIAGQSHKIFLWAAPITLTNGSAPVALIAGAIDLTDRHHLIEQLQTARVRAEEANRAKSNFLATMSHEIRTPMNAVMGLLELLVREGRLAARDRESAELAHASAQSLLGLIDDILDISKIEAGAVEIVLAPARLRSIVNEVAQVFRGLARQRGLDIRVEIDPALADWHLVDAARFRQIANNLISNSIKYTDAGGVTLRLRRADLADDVEAVVLEVEDTGIGIAAADVEHLFQPFFQAEAAGPRAIGGTGLGLPIVQRLCLQMGGQIEVASQPGRGTSIRIRLPLRISHEPESAAPAQAGPDPSPASAWQRSGKKVLAVDDHPANRLLLERQLAHLGVACELAEDGEDAWVLWQRGGFDLVLTDCSMPRMDGYALARNIRAREREQGLGHCPVLGCTAHVQEEDRRLALDAGMDDCLMKPLSLKDLSAALRHHLGDDRPADMAAPAPLAAPSRNIFDPMMLQDFSAGDVGIEIRFLELLLRSNRADAEELTQRVSTGEWRAAAAIAHKIKGAARLIDAVAVIRDCEAFEHACTAGGMDAPGVMASVAGLAASLDELERGIVAQLARLKRSPAPGPSPMSR